MINKILMNGKFSLPNVKRTFFYFSILMLTPFILFSAEPVRISIGDFEVQSDNPQFKYLGKAFSEFVGVEISKSKDIKFIEREKIIEIIKEQKMSLTGLIDEKTQIEVGKILAASYLVMGNIFDIAGKLSVTIRVVNVTTSEILFKDTVNGTLENYDYISAAIAEKILKNFQIQVPEAIVKKTEKPVEKPREVAVKFSRAVNAYDLDEIDTAKKELEEAKKLDPESDAVRIYLEKLIVNTSKFKTISEQYFPNMNPAYLGIIKSGRLFFSFASANLQEDSSLIKSYNKLVIEQDLRTSLGYYFPLAGVEGIGMGIEFFFYHYKDQLSLQAHPMENNSLSSRRGYGGIVSLGYEAGKSISIGGGISLYNQWRGQMTPGLKVNGEDSSGYNAKQNNFIVACSFGFLFRNNNNTRIFDTLIGYSPEKAITLNPVTQELGKEVKAPVFLENTMTFGLNKKKTFIVLKQLNDIYIDRDYYVGRFIPAVEHWFLNWLSLRGGLEGSYINMEGKDNLGIGGIGGITLRSMSTGLEFDINFTYRKRPSRIVQNEKLNELIIFFTFNLVRY